MYHLKSGIELDRTFRYKHTEKVEARVRATKVWEVGDEVKYLCGFIVTLSPEEERQMNNRDFSVMTTTRRGTVLLTGPARFVNHDCDANLNVIFK
jgi:histone-lysine N-methyltransferase SUV420H